MDGFLDIEVHEEEGNRVKLVIGCQGEPPVEVTMAPEEAITLSTAILRIAHITRMNTNA